MSPTPRVLAAAAALVALLVAVMIVVLVFSGGGSPSAREGFVILDGERLDAPFEVRVEGFVITVNGVAGPRVGPIEVEAEDAPPQAPDNDGFAMAAQAREAYLAAGGGDAGLAAAELLLRSHPASPTVAVVGDPAYEIAATDADGLTAAFRFDAPDGVARAVDDSTWEALAAERAAQVRDHLEGGGGVVLSSRGVTMFVPIEAVEGFLGDLDAALALGEAGREAALVELLGAPLLVEEAARDSDSGRLLPIDPSIRSIAYRGRTGSGEGGAPAPAFQAGNSKTPGKKEAYTFATLYHADSTPFEQNLIKEGYQVWIYDKPARGFDAFVATSGTGALYLATHSSPNTVSVQSFPNRASAAREWRRLRNTLRIPRNELTFWNEDNGTWWIDITATGIRNRWQSNDSIVHAASCQGVALSGAFNAREFFAYQPTTTCAIAQPDTTKLWGRWSGEIGDGAFRSATRAFGQGGFSGGFRYVDGSPDGDTVLSPSVVSTQAPDLPVGAEGSVLIGFDAVMDTSTPASASVILSGCARLIAEPSWQFESLISLPVRAERAGETEVRVLWVTTTSPANIHLDGNQTPEDKNGVIENRDDYVFTFNCIVIETETPDPTSTVPPPVTPEPEGTSITTGGDGGTGESTVEVTVLILGGERYPIAQFRIGGVDACDASHYHGGPVVSLEGSEMNDPNQPECGYGKVSELPQETIQVPASVMEAYQQQREALN